MKLIIQEQELVLDKKDLWEMIKSCHIPFKLGNPPQPGIYFGDEEAIKADEGRDSYGFHWNSRFKYGKYWTVEYMWRLYIALKTLDSFVWSDVDKIELKEESMILNVPVKCLIKLKRNEQQ